MMDRCFSSATASLKHFVPQVSACNNTHPAGGGDKKRRRNLDNSLAKTNQHVQADKKPKLKSKETQQKTSEFYSFPRLLQGGGADHAGKGSTSNNHVLPHGNGSEAFSVLQRRGLMIHEDYSNESHSAGASVEKRMGGRNRNRGGNHQATPSLMRKKQAFSSKKRKKGNKGNKNPAAEGGGGDSQEEQHQQASLSTQPMALFGMGLLHRLEQQAKLRKKRVSSSPAQCAPPEEAPAVLAPTEKRHAKPWVVQQEKESSKSKRYALDDRCIFNFKETQASACFPRQSAQEACQVCFVFMHVLLQHTCP
jgi:hypothetical protein